jgi:zinc protease
MRANRAPSRGVAAATLFVIGLVASCGPRTNRHGGSDDVPWASSGIDWSTPPAIATDVTRDAPRVSTGAVASGARIIVVENHRLPLVAITAIHRRAGGREDGARHGIAALTAEALVRGTEIEASIATDHASHHLVTTTSELAASMDALEHALRAPSLSDAEVARARDRRVRELEERRLRPRTIAAQVFDHLVFGTHPYAWAAEGVAEDVAVLTAADVRAFWERAYRADSLTLIFSGDISQTAAHELAERHFGGWAASTPRGVASAPALPAYAPQLAIVDMPGATDAVVIAGRLLDGRADDTEQMIREVSNTILGGGVTARLERRLHGELAITFGASSSFWRGEWAQTWSAAATFPTDAAETGLREMLAAIETARSEQPTTSEVADAVASLERGTVQRFDTVASSARAYERLVVRGDPLDTYDQLPYRWRAVAPNNARGVVGDAWRDLSIVVVGDRARLSRALAAVGLPIVAFTADGKRVP